MSAPVSKLEYLKKYMSKSEETKEKKKKLRPVLKSKRGIRIVDEEIDLKRIKPGGDLDEDLLETREDAPQIAGIVDERSLELKTQQDFVENSKWKRIVTEEDKKIGTDIISNDLDIKNKKGVATIMRNVAPHSKRIENASDVDKKKVKLKSDKIQFGNQKSIQHNLDYSKDGTQHKPDFDIIHARRRHDSESDLSPPRKRHDSGSDPSPQCRRHDSESDLSPPRKRRDSGSDPSPPRRRHGTGSDLSPPRRRHDSGSDLSPPRRRNEAVVDIIPPHSRNDSGSDLSPPRRKNDSGSDLSPLRRKHDSSQKWSNLDGSDAQEKLRSATEKLSKTLDGKKAGLQTGRALRKEAEEFRRKEDEQFQRMSIELSGKDAETMMRTSKRRELDSQREKEKEKEAKMAKLKELYDKWGKGLKQQEVQNRKIAEDIHEMSKPLARFAEDQDLENLLKNRKREEDPMDKFLTKKKEKSRNESRPMYRGPAAPPNRYGILPGFRWDGVDRSNGFEKLYFEKQNKAKALQEEAYKWSVSDM